MLRHASLLLLAFSLGACRGETVAPPVPPAGPGAAPMGAAEAPARTGRLAITPSLMASPLGEGARLRRVQAVVRAPLPSDVALIRILLHARDTNNQVLQTHTVAIQKADFNKTVTFDNLTLGSVYRVVGRAYKEATESDANLISVDAFSIADVTVGPGLGLIVLPVVLQNAHFDARGGTGLSLVEGGLVPPGFEYYEVPPLAPEAELVMGGPEVGEVDGPAADARFRAPTAIAVGDDGRAYVADSGNNRVRVIASDGGVSSLPGPAISGPAGLAIDPASGTLYVSEAGKKRIVAIPSSGPRSLYAASAALSQEGDPFDGVAPARVQALRSPAGLAVDAQRRLVVADANAYALYRFELNGTAVERLAGSGAIGSTDGPAASASFTEPRGVSLDADGSVLVADTSIDRLRRVAGGQVSSIAGVPGGGSTDGVTALSDPADRFAARFRSPSAVIALPDGSLLVADSANGRLRQIKNGEVRSLPLSPAPLEPVALALSPDRSRLYVVDKKGNRVLRVRCHF